MINYLVGWQRKQKEDTMEHLTRFLYLLARYSKLTSGEGFTIYLKLDELPLRNPDEEVAAAERAGHEEVGRRLAPIAQLFDQIMASLRERKQLFKHETRGAAFDTNIPWTDDQLALLGRIESELETINTFVRL